MGIESLGNLPGGTYSSGFAINDLGWVAGGGNTTNSVTHDWPDDTTSHTFRYTDESGLTDVGGLFAWGASSGDPTAMNNLGIIVGAAVVGATDVPTRRGFIVFSNTAVELPNLGGNDTVPLAINNSNVVVGRDILGHRGSPEIWRPFIWTETEGMVDLNDYIDPASGYHLWSASDINNRGQIVAYASQGPVLLNPIPPRVRISHSADNTMVTWDSAWPGVVLEATASLEAADWQPVDTSGANVLALSATNTMRFFRLNLEGIRGLCCAPE